MRKSTFISTLMTLLFTLLFASMQALANPVDPDPTVNTPHTKADDDQPQSTQPLQPLDVTQPVVSTAHRPMYFYNYDSSLSLNVGVYTFLPSIVTLPFDSLVSLTYVWPSSTAFHLESALETLSVQEGRIWTDARWSTNFTEKFRPFYGVGAGFRVVPSQGLATFLQLADYFLRASGGFEYSIANTPTSLRGEGFALLDFRGNSFFGISLGCMFGM